MVLTPFVSVPYRGATFLNTEKTKEEIAAKKAFPSPIGELHFSMKKKWLYVVLAVVSVPYRGATFLNLFQSSSQEKKSVSVPYRGATFLNSNTINRGKEIKNSFRPLSGSYISQSVTNTLSDSSEYVFPSPIGELHFSIRYP